MFGVSAGAINTALRRNGITRKSTRSGPRKVKPGWPQGKSGGASTGRGARSVSEKRLLPWAGDLGVKSDSEISELCGLSSATVARIRRSRGIAPAVANRGQKTGGREGSTNPTHITPHSQSAWKVRIANGDIFVVLAKDIEDACSLALAQAPQVVSLEFIGVILP